MKFLLLDRRGGEIGAEAGCKITFVCSPLVGLVGFVTLETKVESPEEKGPGDFSVEYVLCQGLAAGLQLLVYLPSQTPGSGEVHLTVTV